MTTKHTDGPWQYQECYKGGNTRPFDRFDIFHVTPPNRDNLYGVDTGSNHVVIATVRRQASKDKTQANARLIAAAPELLTALYAVDEYCQMGLNSQNPEHWEAALQDIMLEVRTQINKARGR